MWNLNGDDLQRAKEELKGRRAAIQARYQNELKQLEVDLADIETFERFAVKFVSDFKAEERPSASVAEPSQAAEALVAEIVGEQSSAAPEEAAAAPDEGPDAAASPESAAGQKNSSRWRMRLNAEASP